MSLKACAVSGILPPAIAVAAPALAHHSFAMFDQAQIVTAKGTVKELEWVNPHSWLRVMIADPATGKQLQWAFEMSSPATMTRLGLTSRHGKVRRRRHGDLSSLERRIARRPIHAGALAQRTARCPAPGRPRPPVRGIQGIGFCSVV